MYIAQNKKKHYIYTSAYHKIPTILLLFITRDELLLTCENIFN